MFFFFFNLASSSSPRRKSVACAVCCKENILCCTTVVETFGDGLGRSNVHAVRRVMHPSSWLPKVKSVRLVYQSSRAVYRTTMYLSPEWSTVVDNLAVEPS